MIDKNKKVMETLREYIGKEVTVRYVGYGQPQTKKGVLKGMTDFSNLELEGAGIPFVGYGSAIQEIVGENGEVLYKNPLIPDEYGERIDEEKTDAIRAATFGEEIAEEIASKFRAKMEEWKQRWEKIKTQLEKKARAKTLSLMKKGESLIKPELKDEWKELVSESTKDFYSAAALEASLRVMKALSEDKSPKEAKETVDEDEVGISGFQMGWIAQVISYFHPRGEEFRQYWNKRFLSEEKAKETKGVVNPGILTISLK